jgi:hypothetical protein
VSSWRLAAISGGLVLALACERASSSLARLDTRRGAVERDLAARQGTWQDAGIGSEFRVGDGVRTAGGATAKLTLADKSGLVLQEKTLLRFLAAPPGKHAQGLDLQSGEVELSVGTEPLSLDTPAGLAVLDAGSRVRLRKTDQGARFAVEIGAAHLTDSKQDVKAGEAIEIGIGRAVIEKIAAGTSPAPAAASAASVASAAALPPSPSAVASALEPDTRPHGPDLVDVLLAPGDSVTLHDPKPPTAIAFTAPQCGTAVLELGASRRATVGTGRVSATFPAGATRYRVRCDGETKPLAEGTVSVLKDAGSRRLSTAAPVNRIDTDGRRYTIMYQSLLPKVSVRWPNPPASGPFVLGVSSPGKGTRQFNSANASYSLPAGALGEGSHELWFEASGERSRRTSVVVQFDNAAPTASISSPPERGFAPGATVSVSGSALPGWSVSAAGRDLAQDAQQRFSGECTAPADASALLIRFSHPQRGVHYYLRRSSR